MQIKVCLRCGGGGGGSGEQAKRVRRHLNYLRQQSQASQALGYPLVAIKTQLHDITCYIEAISRCYNCYLN